MLWPGTCPARPALRYATDTYHSLHKSEASSENWKDFAKHMWLLLKIHKATFAGVYFSKNMFLELCFCLKFRLLATPPLQIQLRNAKASNVI